MQGGKLYAENLDCSVTGKQGEGLFSDYGVVKWVKIIEDKGFEFVEMSSREESEKAMETLNSAEFERRTLKIDKIHLPKCQPRDNSSRDYREY